jgi:aminopeptidase YwaD
MLKKLIFLLVPFISFGQLGYLKKTAEVLCSDSLNGRGYVNGGDSLAALFIAQEFKNNGIPSLKKSYFQPFDFDVNTFPGKMFVEVNNEKLNPGIDFIVDASSAGFRGVLFPKVISYKEASNQEELIKIIKEIKGSNKFNAVTLDFTDQPKDSLKKLNGLAQELASILPVIEVSKDKFTWSVSTEQFKNPLLYIQKEKYTNPKSLKLEIEAKLIKAHQTQNVVACLKAKNKKAKTLVFTAHYDHLGRMGSEVYFPGANDNASGVATLLTLAKKLKAENLDYNFVFIAFAGEEIGLLGSKYYVEHPLFPLEKIDFLTNLDIMGSGEEGITAVNATLFPKQFETLKALNDSLQTLPVIKSRGAAANSDHYWFTQHHVPCFFIYTMGPNKNYHDINDTFQNLSFAKSEELLNLLFAFAKSF